MTPVSAPKAILYCRVSDKKQKHDGDGLHSQEHRCREYAVARGYEVEAVFHDDVSGGGDFMKRPGMVAMLNFLDTETHDGYVVIFDDLKRFARDTIFHLTEVKRWLEAQPAFPKVQNGIVLNQTVTNLLTRPVYAGMVEAPKWGVSLRKDFMRR